MYSGNTLQLDANLPLRHWAANLSPVNYLEEFISAQLELDLLLYCKVNFSYCCFHWRVELL